MPNKTKGNLKTKVIVGCEQWAAIKASQAHAKAQLRQKIIEPVIRSLEKNEVDVPLYEPLWSPFGPTISPRNLAQVQNAVIERLHIARPDLNNADAKEALVQSAAVNDFDFFIRLGRLLENEPYQPFEPDRVIALLLSQWTRRTIRPGRHFDPERPVPGGVDTPLCFYSTRALAQYCRIVLGKRMNYPLDTEMTRIDKLTERIGLRRAAKTIIQEVVTEGSRLTFYLRKAVLAKGK